MPASGSDSCIWGGRDTSSAKRRTLSLLLIRVRESDFRRTPGIAPMPGHQNVFIAAAVPGELLGWKANVGFTIQGQRGTPRKVLERLAASVLSHL
jgi:hypothetical protein